MWLCRNIPISGNGFSGFGGEEGEGAGVARGMRKGEADRLKEARALVSTRQAHERTHARTHTQINLWTGRDRRTNPRTITKTRAQTRDGQGGNRRIQHTHTLTRTRKNEQVLFDTRKAKKAMHSFYKNKKPGKQRVFQEKKDAKKKEAAGWEGPAAEFVTSLKRYLIIILVIVIII
jgi:hypothetical protein